ncbi:ABC transporter substrate-binding protein [Oryzomonas sagensis]|nr:ABC transporter substrate-binding protein [Oryzomonas sagensis]
MKQGHARCLTVVAAFLAVLSLLFRPARSFAAPPASSPSFQEAFRQGERIYREGVLPSGKPLPATLKDGAAIPGTTYACVSCHLRSGLGSTDNGVVTPSINGAKLFKPFQAYSTPTNKAVPLPPSQVIEQTLKSHRSAQRRPVYTDATLAAAVRNGVDSAGRVLSDVMPRYILSDADMKSLIFYLRSLSSEYSPGVTDTTVHFATIVADDVGPGERNAMLAPLENFIRNKNQTNYRDPRQVGLMSRSAGYRSRIMADIEFMLRGIGIKKLALSRWVLKGPPGTWRDQLAEYYRKEPVFAILGGITTGEWQPVHQFCEENRIPCIFPITDYPVISPTDWYTLYLSKGYYLEGEGAARFLAAREELKGRPVIQVVRDTPEGRALSQGFLESWRDFEQKPPVTVTLKQGEALTGEFLQQEQARENPAAIILWDGPESLKALAAAADGKDRPAMVLASSTYLGSGLFSLDEKARGFTYLTYPYGMSRSPQDKVNTSPTMGVKKFNPEANAVATTRISQQSYILTLVLDTALWEMKGNYYRDNLLDAIGTIMDLDVPLYERLSFGPGQRYVSRECYIVRLSKSGLVKNSWGSGWTTR